MNAYTKFLTAILFIVMLGGCQDYNELVQNKNVPTSVPPATLLAEVLNHLNDQNAWDGKQGSQSAAQFYISTYDYYGTNNYDQQPFIKTENNFEYVVALQNVVQMELEAKKSASTELNPYSAMAKFLKAYYYNLMSQKMGDLPLSQALLGEQNKTPEYDTQKQIYIQILKWLEEANNDLSQLITVGNAACVGVYCNSLAGDAFLGNSLSAWQKVINSFTLRVLISLSKKETDSDLNIKQKFANIINNPAKYPVLTGLSDNLQYTYNISYNNYPKNPTSQGRDATRENVGAAFLSLTTALKDPRTFVAATPAPRQLSNNIFKISSDGSSSAIATTKPVHNFKVGQTVTIKDVTPAGYNVNNAVITGIPTDSTFAYTVPAGLQNVDYVIVNKEYKSVGKVEKNFTDQSAYIGAPAGLSMSDLGNNAQGGLYSYINAIRYYADFAGSKAEPAVIIGYPELCFNIAEGVNRGWAVGDASTWYVNGITASMNFLGITEGSSIKIGDLHSVIYGTIDNISITAYLAQPSVKYKTGVEGLAQILTQKYISFWQNSNWEAFFNQRRTGVPSFSEGPGSGNGNRIAKRWQYPVAEANANPQNYNAAIQRQFGGVDDLNGKLWIIQ
jgi:hypothetical protein